MFNTHREAWDLIQGRLESDTELVLHFLKLHNPQLGTSLITTFFKPFVHNLHVGIPYK